MGTALQQVRGQWAIRPGDADVAFRGRASRLAPTVRARFGQVSGTVRLAEHEADSEVHVEVDLTSMTTGNATWDELLRALDPFDVGRHPVATYRSRHVRLRHGRVDVEGDLVLRDRRTPVCLAGRHVVLDDERARLVATGEVDATAFGLRLDVPGAWFLLPGRLQLLVDVVVARQG